MQVKTSYEELDLLVKAYQDGKPDAAEKLVQLYEGYFRKFLNVLKYKFTITDRTQRGFIRYFIRNEEARGNTHLFRQSDYIRRVIYATVSNVKERFNSYEPDELKSEMVILFLEMADNHNFKAPFGYYLSQYFPRKFYKVVKELTEDTGVDEVYLDEDDIETAHFDEYDEGDSPRYFIQATTPTEYDENWVNGFGCGEIFEDLTTYERRIIKWYYESKTFAYQDMATDLSEELRQMFKVTEDDIADRLGCSRKTVNLKRNEIKRRIEEMAQELHLLQDKPSLSHI